MNKYIIYNIHTPHTTPPYIYIYIFTYPIDDLTLTKFKHSNQDFHNTKCSVIDRTSLITTSESKISKQSVKKEAICECQVGHRMQQKSVLPSSF